MFAELFQVDESESGFALKPPGIAAVAFLHSALVLVLFFMTIHHSSFLLPLTAGAAVAALMAGMTWGARGGVFMGILLSLIPLSGLSFHPASQISSLESLLLARLAILLDACLIIAGGFAAGILRDRLCSDHAGRSRLVHQEREAIRTLLEQAAEAEDKAGHLAAKLLSERRLTAAVTRLQDAPPEIVPHRIVESTRHALGKGRAVFYRESTAHSLPFSIASDSSDAASGIRFRDFVPVVLKSNRPLIVRDTARNPSNDAAEGDAHARQMPRTSKTGAREAGSLIAVVVRTPAGARGVLSVESDSVNGFSSDDLKLLENFSESSALSLQYADHFHDMKRRALYDTLTGLLRPESFRRRVRVDIQRAIRYGHCASLILFHLDGFPSVAADARSAAGDDILRRVAAVLRDVAPAGSNIGRLGDEEFALSFIGDDPSSAGGVADMIRTSLSSRISRPDDTPLTASFGVAICPLHADNAPALLKAADAALVRARNSGQDRVETPLQARYEANPAS